MHIRTFVSLGVLAAALVVATPASAQPQPKSFGFGIIVGEPTGITLKGSIGGNNAWDAGIGASWFGRVRIHGDYLWAANVFNSRKAGMYFGLGAVIGFGRGEGVFYKRKGNEWHYFEDDGAVGIGARASVGVNFMPWSAPVEIFGEIAPVFGISPTTGVGWDAALGIRYYP